MHILSSPDRKWTKRSESIMKTKLQVGSNKIIIKNEYWRSKKTKGEWLLGGTLSLFRGKQANYIEQVYKDKYGQWNVVIIKINRKAILFVILYRLLDESGKGIYTVKAQMGLKK